MPLNEKQARFVDCYIQNPNASAAARQAGYSPVRADAIGYDLLRKTEIQTAVHERSEALKNERTADIEEVLTFLTATMRGEITEVATLPDGSSVSIPPRMVHRLRAADLLAKARGAYLPSAPELSKEMTPGSLLTLIERLQIEETIMQ